MGNRRLRAPAGFDSAEFADQPSLNCMRWRTKMSVTLNMTFWEKAATTRWGAYVSEVERRLIIQGQSLAAKPANALEVGCEGGRWSKLLADLGWMMTCIDVNAGSLAACREKLPKADCILANPSDKTLPCPSNSMALSLCIEVAPVMQSDWFPAEASRVLQVGGILVGMAWNSASLRGLASSANSKISHRAGNEFYRGPYKKWKRSVCQAGFQIVREEGLCWAPFGRSSNSRLIPLATRLEAMLGLRRLIAYSPWVVFIARKEDRFKPNQPVNS